VPDLGWLERARQTIAFPLTGPTVAEARLHGRFREQYGCDVHDVDRLIDVFFPRV
jgi:hypothetical protein